MSEALFRCPKCPFFSQKLARVGSHAAKLHGCDVSFNVVCGVDGCAKFYTEAQSYRRHLYRCHRKHLDLDSEHPDSSAYFAAHPDSSQPGVSNENSLGGNDGSSYTDDNWDVNSIPDEEGPAEINFHDFIHETRKIVCRFFFQLTEEHKVAHSSSEKIFNSFQSLIELILGKFAEQVRKHIHADESHVNNDLSMLLNCTFVKELFAAVKTSYQREQFAKAHFPYVAPQQCALGENGTSSFQYTPIGRVIGHLLEIHDLAECIEKPRQGSCKTLRDFRDGSLYKRQQSSLISTSSAGTVYILLYTDELEIVNPLGSKRRVHKLYDVYFSLLNLHPKYGSQLKHLHLVVIAKYADVQHYGHHEVLKPLLTDLVILRHEGLQVMRNGSVSTVNIVVQAFTGDNLSMNKLGGFTTSFSGGRVCRFCMAQAVDFKSLTREELCVLRTEAAHQKHLATITVNSAMKRLYGVNEPSPLLALDCFDVTLQLPPDLMHDLLEGSFGYVMHHVLRGLVDDGVLGASDIEKIVYFSYGHNDKKNKPEAISITFLSDHRGLKGTASQKWCLFRLLPLIFGSSIPEGNKHWSLYLAFREIVDVVLAEEVPIECVPYLEVRTQDFLSAFVAEYPSARLTPKLHYLIHYPRFIAALGPLRQYWCMRFEAKHQYFKTCFKSEELQKHM